VFRLYFVPILSALIGFQRVLLVACTETHEERRVKSLFLSERVPHGGDYEQ
jgi:hypothetical protein